MNHLLNLLLGAALLAALELLWFWSASLRRRARRRSVPGLPPPGSRKAVQLAGRAFRRKVILSVGQEEYFTGCVQRAGVAEPNPRPGESMDDYSVRIFGALHQAGMIRPMLAGLIVPADAPEEDLLDTKVFAAIAAETAEHLVRIQTPADKDRYHALFMELLVPFYRSGLASWARSRLSGAASGEPAIPGAPYPAPSPATGRT